MRIFTKKAFKFMNREKGQSVTTVPFSFHDVPEWVKKDPIFNLAVGEGSIEAIESKQRQKQIENNPNSRKSKPPKDLKNQQADSGESEGAPDAESENNAGDGDVEDTSNAEPDRV